MLPWSAAALLALGGLSLWGRYDSDHGKYWMTKANGSFHFAHFGQAFLVGVLLLLLYLALSSAWFPRFEARRPAAAVAALHCGLAAVVLLGLIIAWLIVSTPVA